MPDTLHCSVEIREATDGPVLHGVVLQEGRAAQGGRAEVFSPQSVIWPSTGIALLGEHHGPELARAIPTRAANGEIRIAAHATPEILAAYETRKFFSVEFHALREIRTTAGVREIQRALLDGAALVASPEYPQAVAEVRARSRRVWLLKLFHRRRPVEVRESYTDTVLGHLVAASAGVGDGGALAAVETASRWWALGLSSATVSPANSTLTAVTPSFLAGVGRSLCRSGESLHVIDVSGGRVSLTPIGSWTVHGSADPTTWKYRCTMNGPTTTRTTTLDASSVLHVRYAASPASPWRGRSPVQLALDTFKAASLLETATAGELNFTQSQMLTPRRGAGDYAPVETLSPDTIQKIVTAFAEHVSTGAFIVPADVTPSRLGPEPPDSFALLRDRFENSILAMCGIPPALVAASGTGMAIRESFRQVLHSLLKPLGALVVEELQAKLDEAAALDFSALEGR